MPYISNNSYNMRNFLSVKDVPDVEQLAQEALSIKYGDPFNTKLLGSDKTMVLLFLNPSLRTRLSTQKAAQNLGMQTMVLNAGQDSWNLEYEDGVIMNGSTAEHVKEAAAVISQYASIVGLRTFPGLQDRKYDYSEHILGKFLQYVTVPLVNMESATRHPLQSLADLVTIREFTTKKRPKVVLTWAPHVKALPQAVPNSFCEWMRNAEVDFIITNPEGYDLAPDFRGDTPVIRDQNAAFQGADFIYAKNWSSYEDYGKILSDDYGWRVTMEKMALTDNGKFMHCLPVRRNVVVEDAVLDSPYSVVIPQAGNREWAAQAVIRSILLSY